MTASFGSSLKIAHKIPLYISAAAILTAIAIGISSFISAETELKKVAESRLTAVMEGRRAALGDYLSSIEQDIRYTATNPNTLEALRGFTASWNHFGGNQTKTLQDLYINKNPHPTGEKEKLDAAADGSSYSATHKTYHPWFRQFLRERDYYDIFLFDLKGNLVYSVFKELDYATNLNSGQWKDTDLGNVFRAALNLSKAGELSYFDFKPYAPSADAPASFIGTPLFDGQQMTGVLVFQMPIARINSVMQLTKGMGESGESYIVGADFLMRSDSRFSEESTILTTKIENTSVANALSGDSGVHVIDDYRGVPVVSAYGPLAFNGTKWAILSEIDEAEALAGVIDMEKTNLIYALGALVVTTIMGTLLARGITGPVRHLTEAMGRIAEGEMETEVPSQNRRDEVGEMAKALQVFKDNAIRMEEMREEHSREEKERARKIEERNAKISEISQTFDNEVSNTLHLVSSAATELDSTAKSMSGMADQSSQQTEAAAAATERASSNVQTVAAASEELSASIAEIGRQVAEANNVSATAVDAAENTNASMASLSDAGQKIGEVVNLINDIASQTNLLALNATIEAARAGEAGKGFAVVASEVKNLATQTAKATEDISAHISSMQEETNGAVDAIKNISGVIGRISEISTSIASAIEEQSAATSEISRNAQEAAHGTGDVSKNVANVSQSASETGSAAGEVLSAAGELAEQSENLKGEIETFLSKMRAV